ncbi:colanic acid biosynthesis glycosyl transferase [Citrobacter braakii]|nr:colanic acid biosynthesis glycosyl transferase [Citrobacter braakii]
MKILVYGINYSPELTGIGKYTGEMVEWDGAARGHDVRVITAPPLLSPVEGKRQLFILALPSRRGRRPRLALSAVCA